MQQAKHNYPQIEIEKLKPNPKNPRSISEKELQKLVKSIQEFGFVEPVIINTFEGRENIIVGGHQRIEAAKRIGIKEVPVVFVKIDESQEHLLNMALNRISGEFDDEKLGALLLELDKTNANLLLSGFDEKEIDKIIAGATKNPEVTEDTIPAYPKVAKTLPGDIWLLGRHRLMCGDSTIREDVKKLMQKDVADCTFTDPPYNLAFTGMGQGTSKKVEVMQNDKMSKEQYAVFSKKILASLINFSKPTAGHYICIDFRSYNKWVDVLDETGLDLINCIVWDKVFAGIGYKYRFRHEFVIFAGSENMKWYGDTIQEDFFKIQQEQKGGEPLIIDMKGFAIRLAAGGYLRIKTEDLLGKRVPLIETKEITFRTNNPTNTDVVEGFSMNYFSQREVEYQEGIVHPTMKPLKLITLLLKNSSKADDIILDLCGGSGSTLMACEQTNRNCRIMEIDPGYCDVIIDRWKAFTGKEPRKQ